LSAAGAIQQQLAADSSLTDVARPSEASIPKRSHDAVVDQEKRKRENDRVKVVLMRNGSLLILTAILLALFLFSPASLLNSHARSQIKRDTPNQPVSSRQEEFINAQEGQKIANLFSKANQAFQKDDYKAGAAFLETAYLINPKDDLIINFLAEAYVAAGDRAAALMWLKRLQRVSPCFFHMPENAASVLDAKDYERLS
jgi:tetratricopeptide repeat protein